MITVAFILLVMQSLAHLILVIINEKKPINRFIDLVVGVLSGFAAYALAMKIGF